MFTNCIDDGGETYFKENDEKKDDALFGLFIVKAYKKYFL